jgi:DnaJ domain
MTKLKEYYETLGLEPGASLVEVKQAYRDLVRVWHPDRYPQDLRLQKKAQKKLQEINEAYERITHYGQTAYEPGEPRAQQGGNDNNKSDSKLHETPPSSMKTRNKRVLSIFLLLCPFVLYLVYASKIAQGLAILAVLFLVGVCCIRLFGVAAERVEEGTKAHREKVKKLAQDLMQDQKKSVPLGTLALMILACLFPPWRMVYRGNSIWQGFEFLLTPPHELLSTVDVSFLILELLTIGLLGGVVWIVLTRNG